MIKTINWLQLPALDQVFAIEGFRAVIFVFFGEKSILALLCRSCLRIRKTPKNKSISFPLSCNTILFHANDSD